MLKLNSSLRIRKSEETLKLAKAAAGKFGVTRVTDTTWLDKIGIPVFASIRPNAKLGSLCVNAGKGIRAIDAKVGAYMEAIEFACCEQSINNTLDEALLSPSEIEESNGFDFTFMDLCPRFSVKIIDKPIPCVKGTNIITNQQVFLPSELVFHPFANESSQQIFGSTSNGLASGNSELEAIVHGICEVFERDTQSFNYIKDRSKLVKLDECSPKIRSLVSKVENANLKLATRYTSNDFDMPYFQAFIMEEVESAPLSVAIGTGCHIDKEIAIIRAITEAAQSRLSHIHGGRDDIIDRVKYFEKVGTEIKDRSIRQVRYKAESDENGINFSDISSNKCEFEDLEDALSFLIEAATSAGFRSIVKFNLSPIDEELQVVKLVIPKAEAYDAALKRVGPRLVKYVQEYR